MNIDDIACMGSQRLRDLRGSKSAYGIDSVQFRMLENGVPELLVVLTSYWKDKDTKRVAKNPSDDPIKIENIVIDGGQRIRDVQPVLVHKFENDESLGNIGTFRIQLNHAGDPSPYSLRLIFSPDLPDDPPDGFDRRYVYAEFYFCTGGIADEDCSTEACHPEENLPHPPIDYVAKDYASFRKLMLDRLSQTVPQWTERCPADLGVTIVEALAYHADHLSYFQDAVGTEAYLQTARRRLSVRRHARFVDYRLHEGCNARAWVFVQVNAEIEVDPQWAFYTSPDTPFRSRANHTIHKKSDLLEPCEHDRLVYEPVTPMPNHSDCKKAKVETKLQKLYPENNLLQIYTWGNDECCLPKGSTSATLIASEKSTLSAGDLLMFEEVKGPNTGLEADANPTHRHMVRLNRVVKTTDVPPGKETTEIKIAEVSWDTQDALPFAFCISSGGISDVTIARGNLVLVDHGLTVIPRDPVLSIPESSVTDPIIDDCQCVPPKLPNASGVTGRRRFQSIPLRPLNGRRLTQVAPFPNRSIQARAQARQLARWLVQASTGKALQRFLQLALQPPDIEAVKYNTGLKNTVGLQNTVGLKDIERVQEIPGLEDDVRGIFNRLKALLSLAEAGQPLQDDDQDLIWVYEKLRSFKVRAAKLENKDSNRKQLLQNWYWNFDLNRIGPATADLDHDPRDAYAAFQLFEPQGLGGAPHREDTKVPDERAVEWHSVADLLRSGPEDRQFVIEYDDGESDGTYNLRFGDGTHGMAPWPGTHFKAAYREGGGVAGNVGIDAIRSVVGPNGPVSSIDLVSNPFPARGGVDPEPTADARFKAPQHFRAELRRAITADDYALLATKDERVHNATATMCWTGTCYEVQVALDIYAFALQNADDPIQEETIIRHEVNSMLERYRSIGHDVLVVHTRYVPLQLELDICVKPHAQQGNVRRLVREVLGNRALSNGRMGYFHPDRLTFGQSIDGSSIIAEVQRVPDVDAVRLVVLRRLFGPEHVGPLGGTLSILPYEIARLDNDKSFPENGRLVLNLRGGR